MEEISQDEREKIREEERRKIMKEKTNKQQIISSSTVDSIPLNKKNVIRKRNLISQVPKSKTNW